MGEYEVYRSYQPVCETRREDSCCLDAWQRDGGGKGAGGAAYAMAFVRPQCWECPLPCEAALENGTAFGSLVMPFLAKEGRK